MIGDTRVPTSQQVSASDAQRLASRSNGHWQGGWHDSTGKAGTSDLVISLDASSRKAKASLTFGGDLLGSPVPTTTYEIDLLSFMIGADSYDIKSPQFGNFNVVPGGANSVQCHGAVGTRTPRNLQHRDQRGSHLPASRCELHDRVRRRTLRRWHHGADPERRTGQARRTAQSGSATEPR